MSGSFLKSVVVCAVSFAAVGFLSVSALAGTAPKLSLEMTAQKEVKVLKDGKEVVETRPAKTMSAGETMLYTITYTNAGDSDAMNAVVSDPVPQGTVYIPGSASGAGAQVAFSIDGGKTFQKTPKQVVTGPGGRKVERDAAPEMYTNIRWTVKKIGPKKSGSVSFKAKVK
jgi:uncharacterized repeat protein (TIGR01451 family)